jgi:DsbC/DsbD-like thiol-disulfide interchange protein
VESELLKPTTIALRDGSQAVLAAVRYPKGERKALGGLAEKIAVYDGRVTVPLDIRLNKGANPGQVALRFLIRYQACDDRSCLAPAVLEVPLHVDAGAGSRAIEK